MYKENEKRSLNRQSPVIFINFEMNLVSYILRKISFVSFCCFFVWNLCSFIVYAICNHFSQWNLNFVSSVQPFELTVGEHYLLEPLCAFWYHHKKMNNLLTRGKMNPRTDNLRMLSPSMSSRSNSGFCFDFSNFIANQHFIFILKANYLSNVRNDSNALNEISFVFVFVSIYHLVIH